MPPTTPRQPLKILFLHGYTQSGPLFHAKTRALVKHLQKLFPLHDIAPVYPTGPIHLDPGDIPGYVPSSSNGSGEGEEVQKEKTEAYGWWRRHDTVDPPLYAGIENGLETIAKTLRDEGPFDGAVGFSQGAAMAAMVGSLLESGPGRKNAFDSFISDSGIQFPSSFENIPNQPPLKFVLCYSGFRAPGARYRGFYENPKIRSPVLHVLGSLDAVVDHGRSRALMEACEGDAEKDGRVVWHPGGHFLPSQRPFLDAAAAFIKERLENKGGGEGDGKEEEDVRDMDLPF